MVIKWQLRQQWVSKWVLQILASGLALAQKSAGHPWIWSDLCSQEQGACAKDRGPPLTYQHQIWGSSVSLSLGLSSSLKVEIPGRRRGWAAAREMTELVLWQQSQEPSILASRPRLFKATGGWRTAPDPGYIHGPPTAARAFCPQVRLSWGSYGLFMFSITVPISVIFHIPLSDPAMYVLTEAKTGSPTEPELSHSLCWRTVPSMQRVLWKYLLSQWIKNERISFHCTNHSLRSKSSSSLNSTPAVPCWQAQCWSRLSGWQTWSLPNKGCIQTVVCADRAVEDSESPIWEWPWAAGSKKGGCKEDRKTSRPRTLPNKGMARAGWAKNNALFR